jgi:hypothetical protein
MRHIDELTASYNNEVANGKWKHIVRNWGMPYESWYAKHRLTEIVPPLDSDAQKNVKAVEPLPEPGPLPRPEGARPGDFVERDGVVSIHAGHFTDSRSQKDGAGWRSVPGLGRTASAVTVLPSTATITGRGAPRLGYRFHVAKGGEAKVHVRLLPTHPLVTGHGLRFAIAMDDGPAVPAAITSGFDTHKDEWKYNVLANATETTIKLPKSLTPGWHTLHLDAVDAGVVVDKIVIDLGGLQSSYNGPEETRIES